MSTTILLCVILLAGVHPWSLQVSRGGRLAAAESQSPDLRELVAKVQGPSAEDRAVAARLLSEMGQEATPAIPYLIDLLKDNRTVRDGKSVAAVASASLVKMGRPAAQACLSTRLKGASREQTNMLRFTIGQFKDQGAVETIIRYLKNPSRTTIRLLDYSDAPQLVPPLIALFDDTDGMVRELAVEHFKRHVDPRVVEPLIERLLDEDESVRYEAAEALGVQGDRRAVSGLLASMKDEKEASRLHRSTAEALGRIGGPEVFEILVAIVAKQDEFTGPSPGAKRAPGPLSRRMSSLIYGRRYGAVQGLGHLGDRRASEMLKSVLCNVDDFGPIRVAAAKSLAQIEGKDAFPVIARIATDPREQTGIRYGTAEHLAEASGGVIDDTDVVAALGCWDYAPHTISDQFNVLRVIAALKAIVKAGTTEQVRTAAKQSLIEAIRRRGELWPNGDWPTRQ